MGQLADALSKMRTIDTQIARIAELEAALELILPLARSYNPHIQSHEAATPCRRWIVKAEAALAGSGDQGGG